LKEASESGPLKGILGYETVSVLLWSALQWYVNLVDAKNFCFVVFFSLFFHF
jgi:hypothetical protein